MIFASEYHYPDDEALKAGEAAVYLLFGGLRVATAFRLERNLKPWLRGRRPTAVVEAARIHRAG